jgi:N-acetylglucosaminyldiphosphoundecaprenol N-acetyl-beta-D-mannosaminyltransferase
VSLPRIDVVDSAISVCDMAGALEEIEASLVARQGGYVCFTNVHAAVAGRADPAFRAITNQALLTLADGKPVYWVGRMKGARCLGHIPGPDFLLHALRRFPESGHFFYGSSPDVLNRLVTTLTAKVERLRISGILSPPFRRLAEDERQAHYSRIRESGAEFVWVGLGAPKQEQWMAEASQHLKPAILLGVGAAFDFHAGTIQRAPLAMRHFGLEWLFRLATEPRRLWRRYLTTNTLFLAYLLVDLIRPRKRHPLADRPHADEQIE